MDFYIKGKSTNEFNKCNIMKCRILNKSNYLFCSRGSWEFVIELKNIHMEDLRPRGLFMGSMDEEIDLKTFVVIIEWFEHFQSQICGYFLLAQAKERKESLRNLQ